jgi:alpha-beta hydrolase superfamily lysophospholipase
MGKKHRNPWLAALLCWLALFETIADLWGWRGLRLGGAALHSSVLVLLRHAAGHLWQRGIEGAVAIVVMLLPALALHVALSSLRNWRRDPRRTLQPGRYADRHITRLNVPTPNGNVPALHIVPHGGTRAVVCYVHGSGCDKTFYTWDIVDTLLARGMAVLLIDLDGHGESPRLQAFPDSIRSFAGVIPWLREHYAHVGVIGTSLGGCVVTRAIAEGTSVDTLVILAAPPRLHLMQAQLKREVLRLPRTTVLDQLRVGTVYHLIHTWITTPRMRVRISSRDLIRQLDLNGSLRQIGQQTNQKPPMLLVYAALDAIVPVVQARQVQCAMPAWATFHLLPEANHLSLTIDRRLLRLVGDWLAHQLL